MINVKNLTFGYRGRARLYNDFSLSLGAGRIYGLLGSNGTGKSTLLKLICGVLTPKSGSVEVGGKHSNARNIETLRTIAIVPEEFSLPNVSVEEYARLTAPFYPTFDHNFFRKALAEFGVEGSQKFGRMSMGQRKKGLIAFAMACGTPILILDEPTNGLDITSKITFRRLLAEWATPERTAIISTHQVKDVENLLDHIVIIDHRGLVLDAPTYEISSRLRFSVEANAEGALYSQPSLGGYSTVRENTTAEESNIDIEMLFGAATSAPAELQRILNPSTK